MSKKNFQKPFIKSQTDQTEDIETENISKEDMTEQQTDTIETVNMDQNKTETSTTVNVDSSMGASDVEIVEKQSEQTVVETTKPKKGFVPVYKVELDLTGYAAAMDRNKSIVPEEGGKWQYFLFNTIKNVFSAKSQEEFNAEFNTILNFFNKNKDGIFNEKFIFRFPQNWPGTQNEFNFYRRIVYFIIQVADPKNRKKALEGINLEKIVDGLTEPQKQLLFNFFS